MNILYYIMHNKTEKFITQLGYVTRDSPTTTKHSELSKIS